MQLYGSMELNQLQFSLTHRSHIEFNTENEEKQHNFTHSDLSRVSAPGINLRVFNFHCRTDLSA